MCESVCALCSKIYWTGTSFHACFFFFLLWLQNPDQNYWKNNHILSRKALAHPERPGLPKRWLWRQRSHRELWPPIGENESVGILNNLLGFFLWTQTSRECVASYAKPNISFKEICGAIIRETTTTNSNFNLRPKVLDILKKSPNDNIIWSNVLNYQTTQPVPDVCTSFPSSTVNCIKQM